MVKTSSGHNRSKKFRVVKKKDSPRVRGLKHKARRYGIKEGIFYSAKLSFGDYYISPFAIAINASNSLIALMSAVMGLFGPLSQLFGSRLLEKHSRKKIVLKSIFLESLIWIPFIILALLFYFGILVSALPFFLLFFFALYAILSNIGHPAWFSWMGDIIDDEYRGRWFSKRNLFIGFTSIIFAVSASFLLDYFKNHGMTLFGFMVLFSFALFARLACWKVSKKQYEPKLKLEDGYYFSFFDFVINAPKNNFGKFSIFHAFLGFASSISSPLVVVYLLRNLGFSYSTYMIISLSGTFFSLLVMNLWGNFADRYGNYHVLCIASVLVPIIPLLYIINSSPIYLIFVPSLISGITWAGFNLASANFIYDNSTPQKRGLVVSYFNMLGGIGIFLGAGLGAFLVKILPTNFIEPIIGVFILGAVARMIVVFFLLSNIREIRKIEKYRGPRQLRKIILKEAKDSLVEEAHELMAINKYLHTK
jgi:MFS family permease